MCQSLALKPGEYTKTWKGLVQLTGKWFAGFATCEKKDENGDWWWKKHVTDVLQVPVWGIGERDTKTPDLTSIQRREVHEFEREDRIVVIVCKNDPIEQKETVRIVTTAAHEDVAKIHDREPLLWLRDQHIWEEIFAGTQSAA